MCRRWRNNHTVSSNYGLRFCSTHLRLNKSEGHVLLYETYRGIPTRFQNLTKAVNTRTRITFTVQSLKHRVTTSHRYRHSRLISTIHRICVFHRVSLSRRVGTIYLIGPFRRISTNPHHTSTRSNIVRQLPCHLSSGPFTRVMYSI